MLEALNSFLNWNMYNIDDVLVTNLIKMKLEENKI